jgi:hypothetical protein
MKRIIVSFIENNAPVTGLTPLIKIRDVTANNIPVNNELMNEIGDGFYDYIYQDFSPLHDYTILCDGGDILEDRYKTGGNEMFVKEAAEAVWNEDMTQYNNPNSFGNILKTAQTSGKKTYFGFGS